MATAAQLAANRANAKSSTGPRTSKGKEASSANATKFGLFTNANYVQPSEQGEYDQLTAGLWDELRPVGHIEDMLAAEVVRCAWRLRRCANSEGYMVGLRQEQQFRTYQLDEEKRRRQPADPVFHDYSASVQAAIDRARSQAQSCLRRAMSDLADRQTERFLREEMLPSGLSSGDGSATLGLACVRQYLAGVDTQADRQRHTANAEGKQALNQLMQQFQRDDAMIAASLQTFRQASLNPDADPRPEEVESTKRTQSAPPPLPRNAPCPCNSGLKHKRCCGRSAPAVLHQKPLQAAA
jgi:SEC-C motif